MIMEQEDKNILLRDLCGRLPYGVKVKIGDIHILRLGTHTRVGEYVTDVIEPCKPYLFPLSSMTEEQKRDYQYITERWMNDPTYTISDSFDWLHKNHFDYRNLINKNLALDCTNLNIY